MGKNTNCLEGVRCPKCEQDYKLLVWATLCVAMTDDGAAPYDDATRTPGETEYDDKSRVECPACEWRGTWGECSIEVQKGKK